MLHYKFIETHLIFRPSVPKEMKKLYSMPEDFPKASSTSVPTNPCTRITFLLDQNYTDVDAEFSQTLTLKPRILETSSVEQLYKNVSQIDPELDRCLFIHVGSGEALKIANDKKPDVEKGVDCDQEADAICDLVEKLTENLPHLIVFVSMLPPRYDSYQQSGMSVPNSVRRVMNVQISSRLYEKKRIFTINNDELLEWGKDEDKRDCLLRIDGRTLTNQGRKELVQFWAKKITERLEEDNDKK